MLPTRLTTPPEQFASFFQDEETQKMAQALMENLGKGSVCIDLEESPGFSIEGIPVGLLSDEQDETDDPDGANSRPTPFVKHKGKLYIRRYFKYETMILKKLKELVVEGTQEHGRRLKLLEKEDNPYFKNIIESRDTSLETDWQLVASVLAFLQNFMIVTGGPGTGKTTTLAKILTLLFSSDKDLRVKLAAPTGKAAMRMIESLRMNENIPDDLRALFDSLEASTIHRLLETNHLSPYFKHNADNPLEADVVIVDESSMIDVALFAKLLDAIPPDARLIMLGDQNQLASVDAGSIFGDLCSSVALQNHFDDLVSRELEELPGMSHARDLPGLNNSATATLQHNLISLQHSYRFSVDSGIGAISKAVIAGDQEKVEKELSNYALGGLNENSGSDSGLVLDENYDEKVFNNFIAGYEDYIQEDDILKALEKLNNLRVLAALREGRQGIYYLNARIEEYLRKKKLIKVDAEFYKNRPVIVTKNYHALQLFNGDVGLARKDENGQMKVWFPDSDNKVRGIAPGYIAEVETVFAMTVHKSQGSEFERVLLVMPKSPDVKILTRELLYTAITRAKKEFILQGGMDQVLAATGRQVKRASGIKERLAP